MQALVVGLEVFEISLIEEFASVFSAEHSTVPGAEDVEDASRLWLWMSMVKGDLNLAFYDEEGIEDFDGDRLKAWTVFLSRISHDGYCPRFGRIKTLLVQNPDYPHCLVEGDLGEEALCTLQPSDLRFWVIIQDLHFDSIIERANAGLLPLSQLPERILPVSDPSVNHGSDQNQTDSAIEDRLQRGLDAETSNRGMLFDEETESVQSLQSSNDYEPFMEIWSLLRSCSGLRRNPINRDDVVRFLRGTSFFDKYVLASSSDQFVLKQSVNKLEAELNFSLETDSGARYSMPPVVLQSLKAIRPQCFLEFIPFADLKILPADALPSSASDGATYALWRSEHRLHLDHHLYTEEEVYRYLVESSWTFPDHFHRGRVLFRLTLLADTSFLDDLPTYWDKWVSHIGLLADDTNGLPERCRNFPRSQHEAVACFRDPARAEVQRHDSNQWKTNRHQLLSHAGQRSLAGSRGVSTEHSWPAISTTLYKSPKSYSVPADHSYRSIANARSQRSGVPCGVVKTTKHWHAIS